jgi:hypothetical protein
LRRLITATRCVARSRRRPRWVERSHALRATLVRGRACNDARAGMGRTILAVPAASRQTQRPNRVRAMASAARLDVWQVRSRLSCAHSARMDVCRKSACRLGTTCEKWPYSAEFLNGSSVDPDRALVLGPSRAMAIGMTGRRGGASRVAPMVAGDTRAKRSGWSARAIALPD